MKNIILFSFFMLLFLDLGSLFAREVRGAGWGGRSGRYYDGRYDRRLDDRRIDRRWDRRNDWYGPRVYGVPYYYYGYPNYYQAPSDSYYDNYDGGSSYYYYDSNGQRIYIQR